ncbi:MAG: hypothetical protein IKG67_01585 [Parasporobacterium sp.]|nr:hypothetical protein [Parasporobacterium sp.]
MKVTKRLVALLICCIMVFSMMTVSMAGAAESDIPHHKIGILGFRDTGGFTDYTMNFLNLLGPAINTEFMFVGGDTRDETINVGKVQDMITAGCDGIIMLYDLGVVGIADVCAAAGVYLGGARAAMESALPMLVNNPFFVGTVQEGPSDDSLVARKIADRIVAEGVKEAGLALFPPFAYPEQTRYAALIREMLSEEHPEITLVDDEVLMFQNLPETYLAQHPDIELIVSIADDYVYPTLLSAGRKDIKVINKGFLPSHLDSMNEGVIIMDMTTAVESILYPLILMVDKMNGYSFDDAPAQPETVGSNLIYIENPEDCKYFIENTLMGEEGMLTEIDESKCLLSVDEMKSYFKTFNPDATYQGLCDLLAGMTMEAYKAR